MYVTGRKTGKRYAVPVAYLRHGEDLLNGGLETQERDHLAAPQVDHTDAAGSFLGGQPLGDWDAAEDGALAHLR